MYSTYLYAAHVVYLPIPEGLSQRPCVFVQRACARLRTLARWADVLSCLTKEKSENTLLPWAGGEPELFFAAYRTKTLLLFAAYGVKTLPFFPACGINTLSFFSAYGVQTLLFLLAYGLKLHPSLSLRS